MFATRLEARHSVFDHDHNFRARRLYATVSLDTSHCTVF